jgi:hypothetical protein
MKTYQNFKQLYNAYEAKLNSFIAELNKLHADFQIFSESMDEKGMEINQNAELKKNESTEKLKAKLQAYKLESKRLNAELVRYKMILEEGASKYAFMTPEMNDTIGKMQEAINAYIDNKLKTAQTDHDNLVKEVNDYQRSVFSNNDKELSISRDKLKAFAENKNSTVVEAELNELNSFIPTSEINSLQNNFNFSFDNFSPFIQIGKASPFAHNSEDDENYITNPFKVIVPFIDQHSLLIIHDKSSYGPAEDIHDSIITRLLMSFNIGKLQLNFCDVKSLGDIFNEFKTLQPNFNKFYYGRSGLETLMQLCETNIQKIASSITVSSYNRHFSSLGEFNYTNYKDKKDEMLHAHSVIVIDNLSYDIDEQRLRNLLRICENGARNGANFIILWNVDSTREKELNERFLSILCSSECFKIVDLVDGSRSNYLMKDFPLQTENLPDSIKHELVRRYNIEYENQKNNVSKVHFKHNLPDEDQWFSKKSMESIDVPVGINKANGGVQSLSFFTKQPLPHALLSGGTGSGKTNFLKTYITSLCINYSPEEVELYLIDLKNGAGFSIFQQQQLPHVKLYAFGAENELILNILNQVVNEMTARYVDNLPKEDMVQVKTAKPDIDLKRIVIVIDEFATIFQNDAPFQNEICAKLEILATKGRAMGINLFISTQNFNNVGRQFEKSKSEMPIRIALRSDLSAYLSILATNNHGHKNILTVGDGLINTNFGSGLTDDANEYFKGFLLESEEHLSELLVKIKTKTEQKGIAKNKGLYYNNLNDADITKNLLFAEDRLAASQINDLNSYSYPKAINIWLGEPSIISDEHFRFRLATNFHENILVSGIYSDINFETVSAIFGSVINAYPSEKIGIFLFNFHDDIREKIERFDAAADYHYYKRIESSEFKSWINTIHRELLHRKNNASARLQKLFCFFLGMEHSAAMRDMKDYTSSPEAMMLQDILQEGPLLNIHSICEIRVPSHFEKMYRNASIINLFKHRIVHHLGSSDESRIILGNNIAANIYQLLEPHTKNRAYYYNTEFEQQYQKVRPYVNLSLSAAFLPATTKSEGQLDINECLSAEHSNEIVASAVEEKEKATSFGAFSGFEYDKSEAESEEEIIEASDLPFFKQNN